jgi:hypothetical protein
VFYFGYVTPRQFINRLSKQLKKKKSLPHHKKSFDKNAAKLIIPIQGDSRFVIRVSVSSVDCGDGLNIVMDFRELVRSSKSKKIHAIKDADWFAIILGPYQRKRLRTTCHNLADMIYCHIDGIEGMQTTDFYNLSFVDE